jgi:hypothetical protein
VLPQGPDGVPRAVVAVVADPAVPTVDEAPGAGGRAPPGALALWREHETSSDAALTQAAITFAVRNRA